MLDNFDYYEWNKRLTHHFFRPSKRSRAVRMSVDEDTLCNLGGEKDDLAIAVLMEVESKGCTNIQTLGLFLHSQWEKALGETAEDYREIPPPFMPVLTLYILAVNHGGADWPTHSFYDRLHDLLAGPTDRIDTIKPSLVLWKGLERWATRRLRGRLGFFRLGVVGNQRHVGVPKRQILIATREHAALERAFLYSRLTPRSDPTDRRLHAAVSAAGGLLTRTHTLLARWPRDEAARDLLTEIRCYFDDWDASEFRGGDSGTQLVLPLQLVLRTHGQKIIGATFVTKLVIGVTDRERRLTLTKGPARFMDADSEFETTTGNSDSARPIVVDTAGDPRWAMETCWFDPILFELKNSTVVISRPSAPYLVFGRGYRSDSLEEVESADIRPGERYILATTSPSIGNDVSIVGEFLGEWKQYHAQEGVWHRLFCAAAPTQEEEWGPSVRLAGGIPVGRGRGAFLSFALPTIGVEAAPDTAGFQVRFQAYDEHGVKVRGRVESLISEQSFRREDSMWDATQVDSQSTRFRIVGLAPACVHCEVEIEVDGEVVASRRFYVDRESLSGEVARPIARDGLGLVTRAEASAVVRGLRLPKTLGVSIGSLPVASRPLKATADLHTDTAARRVMQLMRTRHKISWKDAKRFLPGCLEQAPGYHPTSRYLVHQVQVLHALGVIELEEDPHGGYSALTELPPQLVLLPRLANRGYDPKLGAWNSYQAVLAGCWLSDQLTDLKKAAKKEGAEFHMRARESGAVFAPHFRYLLATGNPAMDRFRRVAAKLDVAFEEYPLASGIATFLSDIDDLITQREWIPGRPADTFETRFFDPRTLGVSKFPVSSEDRYALWECRYQDRSVWRFFIVDSETRQRLEVEDRQVARWFVRRQALPNTPIPSEQDDIFIPLELRFPSLLERMLALSSGRAPEFKRYEVGRRSPFDKRHISQRFEIPAPPRLPVDWLSFRETCTGNFCLYRGVYGTAAWPRGEPMPMLGVDVAQISELGLEDVRL